VKIYLAAPFGDREKMEAIADRLKALGHTVVARWVYGGEDGLTRSEIAILDLDDVDAADTIVSFTFPRGTLFFGGGRHVEFGYALAKGKRLVVIGHRENVFHHFPGVEVYPSVEDWLAGAPAAAACVETV
jgi:nucleoside 2-deoxyribosyltransferase